MRGSGNREDIITEEKTEQQVQTPVNHTLTPKTEVKEPLPFKKPIMPLPENMKVTSIKDTLEKNRPIMLDNSVKNEEVTIIKNENSEEKSADSDKPQEIDIIKNTETEIIKEEVVFSSLSDCWIDCIKESSTPNTIIAVGLLSKQTPADNESHILEIDVPNEVAKQEIRAIIPPLTNCLTKKTGITYSFDIKVVKTIQEKQIDKTNPDEKFIHICKENPKLMEFKQRLRLGVS